MECWSRGDGIQWEDPLNNRNRFRKRDADGNPKLRPAMAGESGRVTLGLGLG